MKWEDKPEEPVRFKLFTKDGKPLRILSTSLGIALLANAAFGSVSYAANADAGNAGADQPKLVEWSTDDVKQYFDPVVDWGMPALDELMEEGEATGDGTGTGGGSSGTGINQGSTVIINNGSSGFGWDDLILYHLLFNRGSSYSASSWSSSHTTYYSGTTKPYKPKTYTSDSFQNKPVAGSSVRPKTTSKSGTVTRRSATSSKAGGIGGNSSVLSTSPSSSKSSGSSSGSSSSKSSSSRSSSGFGG